MGRFGLCWCRFVDLAIVGCDGMDIEQANKVDRRWVGTIGELVMRDGQR